MVALYAPEETVVAPSRFGPTVSGPYTSSVPEFVQTEIPLRIVQSMEFPTPEVLRAAANEINKDIRDELTDKKVGATSLQVARVRVYTGSDLIAARLVAATGMKRRGDHVVATNEILDNFIAVLHEPVADAFYQAGVRVVFRTEHCHCTRGQVWGRYKRILAAGGCSWTKAWDEPKDVPTG